MRAISSPSQRPADSLGAVTCPALELHTHTRPAALTAGAARARFSLLHFLAVELHFWRDCEGCSLLLANCTSGVVVTLSLLDIASSLLASLHTVPSRRPPRQRPQRRLRNANKHVHMHPVRRLQNAS